MSDPRFEERFYRRQRDEIMARIDVETGIEPVVEAGVEPAGAAGAAAPARPRLMSAALPLAAGLLLAAVLVGLALRGPAWTVPDSASADWLVVMEVPDDQTAEIADPLAIFAPEATTTTSPTAASDADATETTPQSDDPAALLDSVLPPLTIAAEDSAAEEDEG